MMFMVIRRMACVGIMCVRFGPCGFTCPLMDACLRIDIVSVIVLFLVQGPESAAQMPVSNIMDYSGTCRFFRM